MLKKTITYEDFVGNSITEDFYFNLTKAELTEMQLKEKGGLDEKIRRMIATRDTGEIMNLFLDIMKASYGRMSADFKRLEKGEEVFKEFKESLAYDALFSEFMSSTDNILNFIKGVLPKDMVNDLDSKMAEIPNMPKM